MSHHSRPQQCRSEQGASAIEHGLLVSAIAAMIAAIVFTFGVAVSGSFGESCATITASTPAPTDSC